MVVVSGVRLIGRCEFANWYFVIGIYGTFNRMKSMNLICGDKDDGSLLHWQVAVCCLVCFDFEKMTKRKIKIQREPFKNEGGDLFIDVSFLDPFCWLCLI